MGPVTALPRDLARTPTHAASETPAAPGRRRLLGLIGLAAAAGLAPNAAAQDGRQSFYGRHQAGIVTLQPAAAIVASFDVMVGSRENLVALMKRLTVRTAALMAGEMHSPGNGLLGGRRRADNLSMTVALGASIFDTRFGLTARRPKQLMVMTAFPNDALEASRCHGDLLIQFNADTAATNIHALQTVLTAFADSLALRWKQDGFLAPHAAGACDTARNLLGFKDGTANLDANSAYLMNRMVWVGDESREPGWAHGGTYQVVRIIRTLVDRWDRTPLYKQQAIIGRDKAEGAPLGMAHERDVPDYLGDPEGHGVPLDAHMRRANPRDLASADRLILRRGYTCSNSLTKAGQLDMGLLFTAFQSDLERGFVAVQTRLNSEPLEAFIKPVGGGYFFGLPGVEGPHDYFARALLGSHA